MKAAAEDRVAVDAGARARSSLLACLTLMLVGCSGPGAQAPAASDGAIPTSASGAPLRGAAVTSEWATHLGGVDRTATRLLPALRDPAVLWAADVGIAGYANSPLVDAEMVYVPSQGTDHNRPDERDGVFALDRRTGARRWFWAAADDINGASLTPDYVVAVSDDGSVNALDRSSGERRWSWSAPRSLYHGPLVVGDELVAHVEGALVFLSASTGERTAVVDLPEHEYMDGRGGMALADGTIVVLYADGGVAGVRDGRVVWQHSVASEDDGTWRIDTQPYATPVVAGERVVTLQQTWWAWDGIELLLRVLDARDGTLIWERTFSSDDASASATLPTGITQPTFDSSEGLPYMAATPWLMNGVLHVLVPNAPVIRRFSMESGTALPSFPLQTCHTLRFPSIVGVPSRMYIVMHDNEVASVSVSNGGYDWVLHTNDAPYITEGEGLDLWAAFRERYVYCSPYPNDGQALFATPAIDEQGSLYIATGDGRLIKIGEADGAP